MIPNVLFLSSGPNKWTGSWDDWAMLLFLLLIGGMAAAMFYSWWKDQTNMND